MGASSAEHTTARIFSPPIIEKIFTNVIRIDMNFNDWAEIDCVKLDGNFLSSKEDFPYEILSMNIIDIDEDNVISTYQFAEHYEINDLMKFICNALYFRLTKNNILHLYK
ncbi:hypothetical protein ABK040_001705 [Willaertia magna]